jgi:hypothetical protein
VAEPLIASPPSVRVMPLPAIVAPVQLNAPVEVNVPLPRNTAVEPLSVAVPVIALLLKSFRPPLITVFATS